jgi:hypothetical protein
MSVPTSNLKAYPTGSCAAGQKKKLPHLIHQACSISLFLIFLAPTAFTSYADSTTTSATTALLLQLCQSGFSNLGFRISVRHYFL